MNQEGEPENTKRRPNQVDFYYLKDFLSAEYADRLLQTFSQQLPWEQQEIRLFGRKIPQPRLTCWFADEGVRYTYSGLRLEPTPWHPDLTDLRNLLRSKLNQHFNSVLANAYRDGSDSMGWHADDEKELGIEPTIASLSFGAVRRFRLRQRGGNEGTDLQLEHGSLLLMQHNCQSTYQHSLPKTAKPVGLRINLTFRLIMNPVAR